MSEVSNEQILQAIYDLSGDVNGLKTDVTGLKADVKVLKEDVKVLKEDVKELRQEVRENTNNLKKLDAKVTVLSEGLLDTQAEVKILKKQKQN